MDYVGEITSKDESKPLDKKRWETLKKNHPNLVAPTPKTKRGINPFTRGPMVIKIIPDAMRVVVDDEEVGSMMWALDDSPCITFDGDERVIPVAEKIAAKLGGVVKVEKQEE